MKKNLIILLLVAISYELNAQQLTLKPVDSSLFKSLPNGFKLNDSALFKGLSTLPKTEQLTIIQGFDRNDKNAEIFYSRMPIAKLYKDDKMPVVKEDDADRMPIKKIIVIDPLAKLKQPAP